MKYRIHSYCHIWVGLSSNPLRNITKYRINISFFLVSCYYCAMEKNDNRVNTIELAEFDCKKGIESFANLIKTHRKNAKLSMVDLYELSGVSSSTINDIEKVKYLPRLDVILKLGYALKLSKTEILNALMGIDLKANCKDSAITTLKVSLRGLGAGEKEVQEILEFTKFKLKLDEVDTLKLYK